MLVVLALLSVTGGLARGARGDEKHPIEHEPIPPDPANDVALGLRLDGDLPPALETTSGLVAAPDPRAAVSDALPATPPGVVAGHDNGPAAGSRFTPDTDTARPNRLSYSDPFTPTTAPWKRLVAFDAVDTDYSLRVLDPSLHPMPIHDGARSGQDERFYGDLVVELHAHEPVRIPSVGPGARVAHARLGVGPEDRDFSLSYDDADNWFITSNVGGRARLVFELAIARAAFGGPFDAALDGPILGAGARSILPANLQREADLVAAAIGVPKASHRETLVALVDYFRSFTESNDPPSTEHGVYLALALSKKGVCRHRAYAFMVTASGLGFRVRVVTNEAHAWVEVHDGRRWKRIDLGGAGTLLADTTPSAGPSYAPPPDPFDWPAGARRGDDLGRTARGVSGAPDGEGSTDEPAGTTGLTRAPATRKDPAADLAETAPDPRAASTLTLETAEATIARGEPVHVRGRMVADGAPCGLVAVAISGRERKTGVVFSLGELATDAHGDFTGAFVVPRSVGVGDYELFAATPGDARCKKAVSP